MRSLDEDTVPQRVGVIIEDTVNVCLSLVKGHSRDQGSAVGCPREEPPFLLSPFNPALALVTLERAISPLPRPGLLSLPSDVKPCLELGQG